MFLDAFFNNSWESNQDFSIEEFNQDIDQHAKLTDEAVQSLVNKNSELVNTTRQAIASNFETANKFLNQTTASIRTAVKNFSNKINESMLKFYNHYVGIQNTTYKPGLNSAGGDTRIDYDGSAVAFVDSLLEAFDELMSELDGFGGEIENEADALLETINAITNEFQHNTELALANTENAISNAGIETRNAIASANLVFKDQLGASIGSFISDALRNWKPKGPGDYADESGLFGGLLGKALDFGGWF